MPFQLPVARAGGDIPQIDDGLAVLRFDDLVLKNHPDWAGKDNYGKDDNGNRYHFMFTAMTPDGKNVLYREDGDPFEIDTAVREAKGGGLSSDERSNAFALLSGILTAQEMALWQAATPENPGDFSAVAGRIVNAQIGHNKKGWPLVEAVIGPFAPAKKKTKAELQAELAALAADEAAE